MTSARFMSVRTGHRPLVLEGGKGREGGREGRTEGGKGRVGREG